MKLLRFLFYASKSVIMGVGVGFTAILTVLSLCVRNGTMAEAKVDLISLTSGYWVYIWEATLLVFSVGMIATAIIQSYHLGKAYKAKQKERDRRQDNF